MDRTVVYPAAIPQDTDVLSTNKNAMVALGYLAQAVLGTGTVVDGLACTPTTPAGLTVNVAGGSIYALAQTDATAYGSLAADTVNLLVKQGVATGTANFACAAPGTAGQSVVHLIQASFQESDGGSTVLPYYNASNPSVPFSGPGNAGTPNYTVRRGICVLSRKTGVAATTGTQAAPAPDAGCVGLWAVTVANGQTTVTSGNIAAAASAPFFTSLPAVPAAVQRGAWTSAADTGAANAYAISPSPAPAAYAAWQRWSFKAAAANTGASTLNVSGLGNRAVVRRDGTPLMPNDVPAGAVTEVLYDGTAFQLLSASPLHAGSSLSFSTGTGTVPDASTRYFGQNHIVALLEADVTFKVPFPARMSRLYGYAPVSTAGTRAYTVRKNGADTALAASCTGATPIATNLADVVDFAAGDEVAIKLITSGGADTTTHKATVMVERLS